MRLAAEKDRRALAPTPALSPANGGQAAHHAAWRLARIMPLIAAGLFCAALMFVNLDRSPRTWFDEGGILIVPKTLVQTGHYADRSGEPFGAFGSTVGVGPTVMLPIAAIFKVGGIGLLGARLVIAIYTIITVAAFALLINRLAGRRIALLATLLMLAAPSVDFISTGRQVLGEMPAFAYLLCGLLVWFTRDSVTGEIVLTRCTKRCIIVGGLFGLTIMTKGQLGIVLGPSLVLLLLLAFTWDRRIGVKQVLVPLIVMVAVFAAWELALLAIIVGGSLQENVTLLRQTSRGSLIVVSPHRMLAGARFVLGPHAYFALLVPALAYTCTRGIRHRMGTGELVVSIFSIVGLFWFVGGSVAWPRYAFIPLALSALPVARLVEEGFHALWLRTDRVRLLAPLSALALTLFITAAFGGQVRQTLRVSDEPQQMAEYLNRTVPPTATIETWEPEIDFLTNHHYHYPPKSLLDLAVHHQWLGGPSLHGYDPLASGAHYLLIGPFGRYTGVYDEATIATRYQQITTIGDYTLFQLKESAAHLSGRGGV